MRLRFRTHLILVASTLTAFTVGVMTLVLLYVTVTSLGEQFQERGVLVTKLITRNIEQGLSLPNRVMDRVGEQMVVSALLAAELVALGEQSGVEKSDDLSARLKRVIERSKELKGYALVDEFWVTNEQGEAYINTEGRPFQFSESIGEPTQSSVFRALLSPNAGPMVQGVRPRALDGQSFCYVGVAGIDKPRIIQVGVGEALTRSIQSDFMMQRMLEQFISRAAMSVQDEFSVPALNRGPREGNVDTDVTRIVLVDMKNAVVAEVGVPQTPGEPVADNDVLSFCSEFIADRSQAFAVKDIGRDVGVVTLLKDASSGQQYVLFVQHRISSYFKLLGMRVRSVAGAGLLLITIAILLSIWLGRRFSHPILELAYAARRLGHGDLNQRINIKADRELEILAEAFNGMAHSLQHHMKELEAETQRRERLESELRIAAEQQRSLLPTEPPWVEGVELAGFSLAAREVGGDFYDYIDLGEGRLGIAIGDATDKGLAAAMLITECWSVLRALSRKTDSPSELLQRTNRALCQRLGGSGRFVTLFYMIVDTRQGRLTYSVAGHNPPFLTGNKTRCLRRLNSHNGLPLGIDPGCEFEDIEVMLSPGDTILLYSDGITEAQDPAQTLYGESRLQEKYAELLAQPLPDMLEAIRLDVELFVCSNEPEDDMTAVAVRFLQCSAESLVCVG